MPTGYTDKIAKRITFKEFALICARAFGACAEMKDDSFDKPIPDEFKPSDYHVQMINKLQAELNGINNLSLVDAEKEAITEYNKQESARQKYILESRNLVSLYKDMLYQVNRWHPPTPEHYGLKEFMIEQINSSIKCDGMEDYYIARPIQKVTVCEWLNNKKTKLQREIEYHTKENLSEIERTESRNKWLKELRDSI